MYSSLYQSVKHKTIFDSDSKKYKLQPRRMESYRKSVRKPIFENSFYYSGNKNKALTRPNSSADQGYDHIQFHQSVHDDFCGCEHNLVPCAIIKDLLVGLNQNDMRKEYQKLQRSNGNRPRYELRKKYFSYLPTYYPQIYHAQLANILSNIEQQLTVNEFLNLAWIEYHAKYEYLTYFLFTDLKNAQKSKKKFFDNLEIDLIKHDVNYHSLIQESMTTRVPLTAFLDNFHQTFAANIVPISQFAKFIKVLLKHGCKTLTKLLIQLLTNKKETLFELLKHYPNANQFREKSRTLLWQHFLEELTTKREK